MYIEIPKNWFFRKQNSENYFFLVQMFSSPMGYLASIMFWTPRQYFEGVSRDLNFNAYCRFTCIFYPTYGIFLWTDQKNKPYLHLF